MNQRIATALLHALPKLSVGAAAALVAVGAHAWDTFYSGGGGRVAALGYAGSTAKNHNPVLAPSYVPGGEISAFGFFVNQIAAAPAKLTYCQTLSSALGKSVFDSGDASKPCSPLGLFIDLGKAGFGSKQRFADFTTTDSPLKSFEVSTYAKNANKPGSPIYGRGRPVQLPAVISSIGIAYNNPDLTTRLDIGSQTLCQIFDGEVTDWNQIDETLPSRPIKVILRADPSSTNFSITNYLNSVCTGAGETFGVSETFAKALPSPLPDGASTKNFFLVPSNGFVSKAVGAIPGAIAYVDAANALSELKSPAKLALVESLDPITNLPEAASYLSSFPLLADTAIGASVVNGRPVLDALKGAAKPGCVLLVDPAASGFAAGGYPIVSVSYLLLSTQGNGNKVTALSKLGSFLTSADTFPAFNVSTPRVTTIDVPSDEPGTGKTGFAAFAPDSVAAQSIQAAALSCVGS